jgi:hypothetical protein
MATKTHTVTLTVEVEVRTFDEGDPMPTIEETMEAWMNYDTQLLSYKAMAEDGCLRAAVTPVMTGWKVSP